MVGDEDGGFWLIHSVPNFPSKPEDGSYIYPLTGSLYGQSFLCISLNSDNLNNIGKTDCHYKIRGNPCKSFISSTGKQLLYNELNMYAKNMPSVLSDKFPHLTDVINGKTVDQPPWFNVLNITSRQGTDFTTFAKTKNFGRDLYRDWVTPTLGSSFFVETWPNGVGRLPSSCGTPFRYHSQLNVLF